MSNETRTYVTISRTEHERLQREARNASSLSGQVSAMSRLLEAMENQNRSYQQQIQNINARANSTLQALSGLQTQNTQLRQEIANTVAHQNEQMQAMAARHQKEIEQLNQDFTRDISSVRDEMHETTQLIVRAMEAQRADLENQMQGMERELRRGMRTLQEQIDAVDQTVQAMQNDDAALRSMAGTYADASNAIIQELQGHRTELFARGRLSGLMARLNHINDDLNANQHGIGATARSDARMLFGETVELRQEVLLAEQRWEHQRQIAIQVIDRVAAQIEASRMISLEEATDAEDVNYWSNNELDHLQARLDALRHETDNRELSIEQIEALQAAAAEISEEVTDTVYFATAAIRAWWDRVDIIADLEKELFDGEQGVLLQLNGDSYQGGDIRAGIRARFVNQLTGLEMAITIRPEIDAGGEIGNAFTFDVQSNGIHNAAFADGIQSHIVNVLRRHGLECTPPQKLPEGDTQCNDAATRFNVEHWRKETADVLVPVRRNSSSRDNRRRDGAGQNQRR